MINYGCKSIWHIQSKSILGVDVAGIGVFFAVNLLLVSSWQQLDKAGLLAVFLLGGFGWGILYLIVRIFVMPQKAYHIVTDSAGYLLYADCSSAILVSKSDLESIRLEGNHLFCSTTNGDLRFKVHREAASRIGRFLADMRAAAKTAPGRK